MLSERFEDALQYACRLHQRQRRKGTGVPYVAHLLSVAALVLEDGGDEDQAIAALLHDGPEDQGGQATLDDIRRRFGDGVADIVAACSDTFEKPKPAWRPRKEAYLQHLQDAPPEVLRVSLADKLHNSRSILRDLRTLGEPVWERFMGGRDGTLWYYHALVQIFQQRFSSPLVVELQQVVNEMTLLALAQPGPKSGDLPEA